MTVRPVHVSLAALLDGLISSESSVPVLRAGSQESVSLRVKTGDAAAEGTTPSRGGI